MTATLRDQAGSPLAHSAPCGTQAQPPTNLLTRHLIQDQHQMGNTPSRHFATQESLHSTVKLTPMDPASDALSLVDLVRATQSSLLPRDCPSFTCSPALKVASDAGREAQQRWFDAHNDGLADQVESLREQLISERSLRQAETDSLRAALRSIQQSLGSKEPEKARLDEFSKRSDKNGDQLKLLAATIVELRDRFVPQVVTEALQDTREAHSIEFESLMSEVPGKSASSEHVLHFEVLAFPR